MEAPFIYYEGQWVSTDSALGKELARWEQKRPFAEFPAMMYKAQLHPKTKQWATAMEEPPRYAFPRDEEWSFAKAQAQAFTESCQKIVNSADERKAALESGEGWQDTPGEAIEWQEKLQKQISTAAAERAYRDRNMSEKAKAEVEAAEAAHDGHMPEMPEQPRRKYTRRNSPEAA